MKRRIVCVLSSMLLLLCVVRAERVMVISDPHVIAQSLLSKGKAQEEMLSSGRKMLDLSEPAFMALIDTALSYRPELVLLPGDLTKDGEKVSHELVAAQLQRLQDAGIKVLVIPGNHDIANKAYAYQGDEKIAVDNISDADFDRIYAAFMPSAATARDTESHSYVSEPLAGVTVLAIDGTDGDASTGTLSDKTLQWLLAQADEAVKKGNMVIAMCHWQIVEHVDQQTMLLSASQIDSAAYVAEQLVKHGVHVALTGHFHINGVTTRYYGSLQDSLVEITTGSPVAYPCPYRWLEISKDRSTITVSTENILSLASHPDLQAYSREWQQEHTANMVPAMARRLWDKVDEYMAQLKSGGLTMRAFAILLEARLPKDNTTRVSLFERYMGQSVVDLYILHSDANENTRPEKDEIVTAFYDSLTYFMVDVLGEEIIENPLGSGLIDIAMDMMSVSLTSMTEDISTGEVPSYENRTDDLSPVLKVNKPLLSGIEQQETASDQALMYDVLGRQIQTPARGQMVITRQHKELIK